MENIPILDQTDVGTCYAYTAAGMIDFWRFSEGDKDFDFHTSPHAAAAASKYYLYADMWKEPASLKPSSDAVIEGGLIGRVITAVKGLGICNYKVFGDKFGLYGDTTTAFLKDLESIYNKFNDIAKFKATKEKKPFLTNAEITEDLNCKLRSGGIPVKLALKDIQDLLSKNNLNDYFYELLNKICKGKIKKINIPDPVSQSGLGLTEEKRITKLSKFIENIIKSDKKVPIGIAYCSEIITNEGPNSTLINAKSGKLEKNCGGHGSYIIGRRYTKSGQCQFLVRNSWGAIYNYAIGVVTDKDGDYWINEEDLLRNMFGLSVINDK